MSLPSLLPIGRGRQRQRNDDNSGNGDDLDNNSSPNDGRREGHGNAGVEGGRVSRRMLPCGMCGALLRLEELSYSMTRKMVRDTLLHVSVSRRDKARTLVADIVTCFWCVLRLEMMTMMVVVVVVVARELRPTWLPVSTALFLLSVTSMAFPSSQIHCADHFATHTTTAMEKHTHGHVLPHATPSVSFSFPSYPVFTARPPQIWSRLPPSLVPQCLSVENNPRHNATATGVINAEWCNSDGSDRNVRACEACFSVQQMESTLVAAERRIAIAVGAASGNNSGSADDGRRTAEPKWAGGAGASTNRWISGRHKKRWGRSGGGGQQLALMRRRICEKSDVERWGRVLSRRDVRIKREMVYIRCNIRGSSVFGEPEATQLTATFEERTCF